MNNEMMPNETNQTTATDATPVQSPVRAPKKEKASSRMFIGVVIVAVIVALLYFTNPGGMFSFLKNNPDVATVSITGSGFSPGTIKVKKGQTVEWVNNDDASHQVASDPYPDHNVLPELFAEQPFAKGESFAYTFETAGIFTYHDQLKPADFKGTVIVE